MKGRDDCSGDASVPLFQLGEGCERIGVTDDAGDGPPAGRVGGLALRAGLGPHGLGAVGGTKCDELALSRLDDAGVCGAEVLAVVAGAAIAGIERGVQVDATEAGVGIAVHGAAPLCVEPLEHVTSDQSTTVRRLIPPCHNRPPSGCSRVGLHGLPLAAGGIRECGLRTRRA